MVMLKKIILLGLLATLWAYAGAQNTASSEVWGGYISAAKINEKWAIWNDFHLVPTGFWANRHGMIYRTGDYSAFAGGYAFITTATPFTSRLTRSEHRPWWQWQIAKPWNEQRAWRARIRYDRRIRRDITTEGYTGEWIAYNRWRLMLSASQRLKVLPGGYTLHLHLMNEILVNNGRQFSGETLDQNRTYLLAAIRKGQLQVMAGGHVRTIPASGGRWNYRYGMTVWVIHNFALKDLPLF